MTDMLKSFCSLIFINRFISVGKKKCIDYNLCIFLIANLSFYFRFSYMCQLTTEDCQLPTKKNHPLTSLIKISFIEGNISLNEITST